MNRQFTVGMREISGFDGSYEEMCREMLLRGAAWLDANPSSRQRLSKIETYDATTSDAMGLERAVMGTDNDSSGMMFNIIINHCLFIAAKGWDAYVAEMSKEE